jgi:hypothetical protein
MGCLPFHAAMGAMPLVPLDIVEATYLQLPPESVLSTTELISRRAVALQTRSKDLEKLHFKVPWLGVLKRNTFILSWIMHLCKGT